MFDSCRSDGIVNGLLLRARASLRKTERYRVVLYFVQQAVKQIIFEL